MAIEERAERREPLTTPPADRAVELMAEQAAALARGRARRRAPPARRDRVGQDRGLPAGGGAGAGTRAGRDRARAGDRADAADGRALPGALRRHRRAAALGARRGERYDEWRRLRSGEARIAVGPRSAVFAPSRGLGLVVVDEEHDSSYKHEGDPRYDARRVAAWRAERAGAALLAGSATPRPETWHALPRLELRERADGRPLPPVRVLDMRGSSHPLHPDTRRALGEAHKAIVLLNWRGWSNSSPAARAGRSGSARSATSRSCCTGRRTRSRATTAATASACPTAATLRLAVGRPLRRGDGAGRGRAAARRSTCHVGSTPTRRGRRTRCRALLARFDAAPGGAAARHADGGQGHDFPDVTLGVVLDADSTLRFPTSAPRSGRSR